ncbi:phosphoglycolate phosphatase [Candidatus Bathyarchaeota archaeon]|nr:MAG: phosphoglycolate phosphatase [Candidatus Bathyarchaeota archaeon]
MKVKVVVTDVDGTLTNMGNKLSLNAVKAVRKLEDNGIPVVLASGNALCVLKTLKHYIGCSGALVAEGGAVVEYNDKVKILGDGREAREVLTELKKKFGSLIVESWSNSYRYVDVALKRTIEKNKLLQVLDKFPSLRLMDSGFAYHIIDKNLNKGVGLKVAAKLMNVKVEEMVTVGDSETDIEMFEITGYRIALTNAPQTLKNLADYVTKNEDGKGFVEAVERIFLLTKNFG